MYRQFFAVLIALVICMPLYAQAETVLRTGDGITVESDQTVDGDYYVSVGPFGTTAMSGEVTQDMYALGGTVTTNGTVGGDLGLLCGIANIHGPVSDDVRIIAGETTIANHVGGDLFVFSENLKVLPTATIDGNVFFYGSDAQINGTIKGSVYGSARNMRIDAVVGKDVDVHVRGQLTLGSRTQISGNVQYQSNIQLDRAQDADVGGDITQTQFQLPAPNQIARGILTPLFMSLFAALSLFLLFRRQLQNLIRTIETSYLKSGLVGIAALLLAPMLSILLMVTVLGFFIGLLSLGATIMLYAIGFSLSGVLIGALLAKAIKKQMEVSLLWIILGTIIANVLVYIPVFGPLLLIAVLALTVGSFVLQVYHTLT